MSAGGPQDEPREDPTSIVNDELLAIAERHLEAGPFALTVVVAQFALETRVELAFTILFQLHLPESEDTLWELLPDRTFMERGTRMWWTELTGDDIRKPREEWRAYTKHVERRNKLAHGGMLGLREQQDPCTRGDAEASVLAVRSLMTHVSRAVRAKTSDASALRLGRSLSGGDWDPVELHFK